MKTLSDLAFMCYDCYFRQGRTPQVIDGLDICAWIRVCAWRAARRRDTSSAACGDAFPSRGRQRRRKLFIDDVM